jgi:hypothetical protein
VTYESDIEAEFGDFVESDGGFYLKQNPVWFKNFPDRIVLCNGGGYFVLEAKRPGESPSTGQAKIIAKLNRAGHPAYWADSLNDMIRLYNEHKIISASKGRC